MKLRTSVGLMVGIVAMIASSGCSDRNIEAIAIDDHVFEVPREHLIEGRIPWLPQSDEKGLMFYIDPEAPVRERITVLIESRDVTCRYADTASEQLARHCASETPQDDASSFTWENVKKINPDGDPTQWSYVSEDRNGTLVTIASCVARADGEGGRCTILGSYTDLVYSLRVRDSEVARIPQIKRTVSELLSNWDKQKQAN